MVINLFRGTVRPYEVTVVPAAMAFSAGSSAGGRSSPRTHRAGAALLNAGS